MLHIEKNKNYKSDYDRTKDMLKEMGYVREDNWDSDSHRNRWVHETLPEIWLKDKYSSFTSGDIEIMLQNKRQVKAYIRFMSRINTLRVD